MNRFVLCLLIGLLLPSFAHAEPAVRRFALLVGVDDGGLERSLLRYAAEDARAVAATLQSLGGVLPGDTLLLIDQDADGLRRGLDLFEERVDGAKHAGRTEVIFYYSGHSDEQGLLLRGSRLTYPELKERLESMRAEVRVAILDSCASGAFTQLKGGTRRAPFLYDESADLSGYAFVTSSSADEAAQESERVEGSFFTRALLAGLQGAADVDGDRRVSLSEAYQHAFHETTARTESTLAGTQHPSYDIRLNGSGDLVLTDLREGVVIVELAQNLEGRVSVRDSRGRLALQVTKVAGTAVLLALDGGEYRVTVDGPQVLEGLVQLRRGDRLQLSAGDLLVSERLSTVTRGSAEAPAAGGGRFQSESVFRAAVRGGGANYYMQFGTLGVDLSGLPLPWLSLDTSIDFNIVDMVWVQTAEVTPAVSQVVVPAVSVGVSVREHRGRVRPYVGARYIATLYAQSRIASSDVRRLHWSHGVSVRGGVQFALTEVFGLFVEMRGGVAAADEVQDLVSQNWSIVQPHFGLGAGMAIEIPRPGS